MKGQAPGAFDGSVPAMMPVTENEPGTGGVKVGGVTAGNVITGGVRAGGVRAGSVTFGRVTFGRVMFGRVISGGGGTFNVMQPGMRASSSDRKRKIDLFKLITSTETFPATVVFLPSYYTSG
jgi:hypothetical protein